MLHKGPHLIVSMETIGSLFGAQMERRGRTGIIDDWWLQAKKRCASHGEAEGAHGFNPSAITITVVEQDGT